MALDGKRKKNIHIYHTQNRSASSNHQVDRWERKAGEPERGLDSISTSIKYRFVFCDLFFGSVRPDSKIECHRRPATASERLVDLKEYGGRGAATTARTHSFGSRSTPREEAEARPSDEEQIASTHPPPLTHTHTPRRLTTRKPQSTITHPTSSSGAFPLCVSVPL